ncbi:esterase FE4 [Plodia interpunctella]|uniref:esterase FE4 n=1 Tax=Plodia interpunctella TaxID=58824 RepID=UPI002367CC6D|nr:esterase FE4-like [Plodia interpunctella]
MKYRKKLVLFTLFAMNLVDQPAPEVIIAQGTLIGKTSADGTFFEYMGIPYASANSSNRFKAPFSAPSWDGIYKATEEFYSCPQKTPIGVVGTEDCLKINVYVPAFAEKPLPVMVYIHGGAFILGSGGKLIYAADFLVKHDVIVVTFHYRLGALGFLCLGIEEAPGNAGLKDQIAALRWVKKNIAAFGGDSDNITIFGESAGATSAAILIASKATNGLFNRAIIQSGSSVTSWSVNRKSVWVASLLTKELGYKTEDPHEIYEILSKLHYKDLIKLRPKKPLEMYFDTQLLHLPCVERSFPGVEQVLDDLPYNLISSNPKNIPVILGSNSNEGLFLVAVETADTLKERNTHYLFASDLKFDDEDEAAMVAKEVKEFYFGEELISLKSITNVSKIYTHLYFEIPVILESELYLSNNNASIYNYYFDYEGGRNFLKDRTGYSKEKGACHADEMFYLFDSKFWPFKVRKRDQKIIDFMTKIWTNFAKYGDPTPPSQSDLPIKWTPSNGNYLNFLYIQDPPKMGSIPNPKAYNLWKNIYTKYRRTNFQDYL